MTRSTSYGDYSPIDYTTSSCGCAPKTIMLSGMKFNDLDGDGCRDNGEKALAGWTIYLDANGNGQFDEGEKSAVTDANGHYSFIVKAGYSYAIREVQQPGWYQTGPADGGYSISADKTWSSICNLDFANKQFQPSFGITKVAAVVDGVADNAGDVINYTITMKNTGNQVLTGVTVTDAFVNDLVYVSGDANNDGKLDLNETWTYKGSHVVTQAELDSGKNIVNTATGDSDQTGPKDATAKIPLVQKPSFTITKVAAVDDGAADTAGELINYIIKMQNTGNMALTGVKVKDNFATGLKYVSGDTDGDGKLSVGETWSYSAVHKITQKELDAGKTLVNIATGDTDQTGEKSATAKMPLLKLPDFEITKTAAVKDGSADKAGDIIKYTILMENTGNTTLTGITVSDPLIKDLKYVSGDLNKDGKLQVSEVWKYTGSMKLTQAQIDSGKDIVNTAKGDTKETNSKTSTAIVEIDQKPDFKITKTAVVKDGIADKAGDIINYTVTMKNIGNMTLTNVKVIDPMISNLKYVSGDLDKDGKLDLNETWKFTGSHVVTQAEIDAGDDLINVVTGMTKQVEPKTATAIVPVKQIAGIELHKFVSVDCLNSWHDANDNKSAPSVTEGSEVYFKYEVTNTGKVALEVYLTDDHGTPNDTSDDFAILKYTGDTNNNGLLDLKEKWTFIVGPACAETGYHTNIATVTGTYAQGAVTDEDSATYNGLACKCEDIDANPYPIHTTDVLAMV